MPNPRRPRFRRLRRVCLLLALGLGTTIAVAWAIEAWSPTNLLSGETVIGGTTEWFVEVPSSWPTVPEIVTVSRGIGRTATLALSEDHGWLFVTTEWMQVEVHAGFPLRSLRRVVIVNQPDGPTDDAMHLSPVQTGLPLPAWLGVDPAANRRLLLMPLWPGLVANTFLYGLL